MKICLDVFSVDGTASSEFSATAGCSRKLNFNLTERSESRSPPTVTVTEMNKPTNGPSLCSQDSLSQDTVCSKSGGPGGDASNDLSTSEVKVVQPAMSVGAGGDSQLNTGGQSQDCDNNDAESFSKCKTSEDLTGTSTSIDQNLGKNNNASLSTNGAHTSDGDRKEEACERSNSNRETTGDMCSQNGKTGENSIITSELKLPALPNVANNDVESVKTVTDAKPGMSSEAVVETQNDVEKQSQCKEDSLPVLEKETNAEEGDSKAEHYERSALNTRDTECVNQESKGEDMPCLTPCV